MPKRPPTIAETMLENTFTDLESGLALLEWRIDDAAKAAGQLVEDFVEFVDKQEEL